jgi:MYXO-CTERM domain-containing protein
MKAFPTLRSTLLAAAVAAGFAATAPAQAYTLTPAPTQTWTTNDNSNITNGSQISSITGISGTFTLQYKANVEGNTEEGPFAPSYRTVFSVTASDPANFEITYVGGPSISCPTCILVVKDGSQEPAQYLFNIGNWNGQTTITGTGFWPNQGAISNVAIWRTDPSNGGGSASIPEPNSSALALLGVALLGAGFAYRRRQQ